MRRNSGSARLALTPAVPPGGTEAAAQAENAPQPGVYGPSRKEWAAYGMPAQE